MDGLRRKYAEFMAKASPEEVDASWRKLQNKLVDYLERRKDRETFEDEIYKWRLLGKWHKTQFKTVKQLEDWLKDKDNNILSSRSFGSCYDGILHEERRDDRLVEDAFSLFANMENLESIRTHSLFQWKDRQGRQKNIPDRDIAAYLFLQNPLKYMPFPAAVFANTAKDLALDNMTMPRWMELGREVILPLMSSITGNSIATDYNFASLDIERDFENIQGYKYLCMLDVQDFIYISWRASTEEGNAMPENIRFYTMLMREGQEGVNDAGLLRKFIEKHLVIAFGDPEGGTGFGVFSQLKTGDIIIVRAGGATLAMTEIISDEMEDYKSDPNFPEFNWLFHSRKIRVLSWYGDDVQKYQLPAFDWRGVMMTCASVGSMIESAKKWYQIIMEKNLFEQAQKLLEKNKQIILTGAPGTGKTYLAKELAKSLTKDGGGVTPHIEFCQFHPSFDYTDFVEGLRPAPSDGTGNIGFERKDGIFKTFCKKAAVVKTISFQGLYEQFLQKIQAGVITEVLQREKKPIAIKEVTSRNNIVLETIDSDAEHKTNTISYPSLSKLAERFPNTESLSKIKNINNEFRAVIGGHCSGYWAILNAIWELKDKGNSEHPDQKYVFIIDEINRGDISKIFGELFYAIEPSYRGEKGVVNTQYYNLIAEGDIFEKGFFVPENVYIIGTMNDIDRSVESMDFAIRRRFCWIEVKPSDRLAMFDDVIPQHKNEAIKHMNRLNKAISDCQGLGEAFNIGPAYFLKLKDYNGDFAQLWEWHLAPLLKEYLRGMSHCAGFLKDFEDKYFDRTSNQ